MKITLSPGTILLSSAWQSPGTVRSASAQMSTKAAITLRHRPGMDTEYKRKYSISDDKLRVQSQINGSARLLR
jgi:hypothetical protein